MIDPATLTALPSLLSAPRFARYRDRYSGDEGLGLRLYAWNTELTAACWGPISVVEVVVRNSIHDAMRRDRRDDWWEEPHVRLLDRERFAIADTVQKLRRRGIEAPTPGQIVAATSFGLWVGLTDAGIPRDPLFSYETALWQPRIQKAFPYLGTLRRKELHRKLDDLRVFRNRLAHHEPIYAAPIMRILADAIDIAGFVHADAAALIDGAQRVESTVARMRAAVGSGECCI
jgi:hypothetical protein